MRRWIVPLDMPDHPCQTTRGPPGSGVASTSSTVWTESKATCRPACPAPSLEMVEKVLRERADQVPPNPETGRFDPYPARLVDGLVELCSTTGDETSRPIPMTIHADLDALSETASSGVAEIELGPVVASETARRLGCESILELTVYSDRCVLGVGRRIGGDPGEQPIFRKPDGSEYPPAPTRPDPSLESLLRTI